MAHIPQRRFTFSNSIISYTYEVDIKKRNKHMGWFDELMYWLQLVTKWGAFLSCSVFTSRGRTLQAASLTVSRAPVIGTIEMMVGMVDKNSDVDGGGSVVILLLFASTIVSLLELSISG